MLLCTIFAAQAQYVTIPDTAFVNWLNSNGYSQCMNGNQMDTTCPNVVGILSLNLNNSNITNLDGVQYFDNLKALRCVGNHITSINELPMGLGVLDVSNNGMNYIAYFPPQLNYFWAANNSFSNLPTLPYTLGTLDLSYNPIAGLASPLPSNLRYLNIAYTNVAAIPTLPATINELIVNNSAISSIPTLSTDLTKLVANNCPLLTSLPQLPASLTYLDCGYNNIGTLPTLPTALKVLRCGGNGYSSLQPLPAGLQELDIANNAFTVLPQLPDTLEVLGVGYNSLTQLPTLPATLVKLECQYNSIATLPLLPTGLTNLNCSGNKISHLPVLPQSLDSVICGSDSLVQIAPLPDTLSYFSCSYSTNLKCLPRLGVINRLDFTGTAVTCIPLFAYVGSSLPALNTLPFCGPDNENGCESFANLGGLVYIDSNQNRIYEQGDKVVGGIKSQLWSGGQLQQQMISSNEGLYAFNTGTFGNYELRIDAGNLPLEVACPLGGVLYDTITAIDSVRFNRNFALRCKTGFDLTARSISTGQVFRPANNTTVDIHAGDLANFYNATCANGVGGAIIVTINGPAIYIAPAPGATAPSNVSGNVVTWNVADFGTTNALADFNIVVRTDTFAQIGQQVCFTVKVTPTVGDNDSSNNTLTYCFPIVNSYDPNDKTAYPSGDIDTAQEWLTYRVRFQNTGNAEAQHIYIMDTLDTDVDASTFQLLAYSHQPNVQLKENIVRFNFPNINLPDSFTNEPGSHGYVQYKVELKENLPLGTVIENTAHIYFDFNPPVVTNTTTNTIAIVQDTNGVGIKQVQALVLNIYPNPANSQVTITTSQAGNTIYMYTAQGQLLSSQAMQGTAATINIDALPSGIYYIELSGSKGAARKKLVKL
jgi:hypothetical protein